jgi:hypothetical protein
MELWKQALLIVLSIIILLPIIATITVSWVEKNGRNGKA